MGEKCIAHGEVKDGEFKLTIKLMSSETLCVIAAEPSCSIARLKESVQSHLSPGQALQSLLRDTMDLKDQDTLSEVGLHTDADLQAVVIGVPRLHLFKPCSACELSVRCGYGDGWSVEGPFGDDGGHIVAVGVQHCGMDVAPAAAQEVVNDMVKAAPNLENTPLTDGFDMRGAPLSGEIIVISNAGGDPKLACFRALAFLDCDPVLEYSPDLWESATLEEKNWGEHLATGFNAEHVDENGADAGLLAVTKMMAERLSDHFKFGFNEDVVTAPVIYGGYVADGSIVGVLSP